MIVLTLFAPGPRVVAGVLGDIRVAVRGGDTVVSLPVSDLAGHRVFTLADPPRLVVDLPGTEPAAVFSAPGPTGVVAEMRQGLFRPDTLRVVVDLAGPAVIAAAGTSRDAVPVIRITLRPTDDDAFRARSGWPDSARWDDVRPSAPAPAGGADLVVAVDPGHGGIDPGAEVDGVTEKALVLDVARVLAARIGAMPGWRAVMTRDRDVFVPLAERIRRAHLAGAHVFLSVHADVVSDGRARGMSVYTLATRGADTVAARLAARENRSDILAGADLEGAGDDVAQLLIDLALRGSVDEAEKLADTLVSILGARTEMLQTRPHRRGNFRVLKAPDVPSVLIELGFLNDPQDRALIVSPEWQRATANAVADALADWATIASPGFLAPKMPVDR